MRNRIVNALILLLLVTACASRSPIRPAQSYTSMPTWKPSSSIAITSTLTFTPGLTHLLALTSTITPNPTRLPSPTSTDTPQPTWTPLPTLEPTAALLFLIDLLENNAGCRLPCWWGLTPGHTTWAEVQHYLESFAYSYGLLGDPNGYQVDEFLIPFPQDMGTVSYAFGFRDEILQDITNIYYGKLTTSYNLVKMLNTYGQPDEILISAYYEPRYSDYMAVVAIFYLQKGILVEYYDNAGRIIGDKIQRCPQKATYPHLSLWSPTIKMRLQDAVNRYLDTFNWPTYRTLQDATGMSVENFYQTFKDVNNTSCIELNVADWPEY